MMKKVLTCCYCGTRAALVLRDHGHHELSCQTCGAPLDHMKQMPEAKTSKAERKLAKFDKPKKQKKKKGFYRKAFGEILDIVDDIFD